MPRTKPFVVVLGGWSCTPMSGGIGSGTGVVKDDGILYAPPFR